MRSISYILTAFALCITTLLSAQNTTPTAWEEIDLLIEKGHYASAYKKSGQLLNEAKRVGNSHAILKAAHKQSKAAEFYQEDTYKHTIQVYQEIIPLLQGADKSIAYLLLANILDAYYFDNHYRASTGHPLPTIDTIHTAKFDEIKEWSKDCFVQAHYLCYEAALAESEALKDTSTDDYDLLVKGDELGLHLCPTLYDVVMHTILSNYAYKGRDSRPIFINTDHALLVGSMEDFLSADLSEEDEPYDLWELRKLQEYTRHHQHTKDVAIRAHIDFLRIKKWGYSFYDKDEIKGLERLAKSYEGHPTEEAMFLYHIVELCAPDLETYSSQESIEEELQKAKEMEHYIARIHSIAPHSEWAESCEKLLKSLTSPKIYLQNSITILPRQKCEMSLSVRNAGKISYRIVPRHAKETPSNCDHKALMRRKSVDSKSSIEIDHVYDNPYQYYNLSLPLPILDEGEYFLIVTNDGKDKDDRCVSITAITITNLKLSILFNEGEHNLIGMAIDATTGRAVTDCKVSLMKTTEKATHLIEEFIPDEEGHFTIPCPIHSYNHDFHIRVTAGASHASYELDYYYLRHDQDESEKSEDTKETIRFTLLPDRHTYQPGELVQFSLIAYNRDWENSHVKEKFPVKVLLFDSHYEKADSLEGYTDEWGHYNGTFTIPKDATPGRFVLWAESDQTDDTDHHTINVEAFKAPTFKVNVDRPTRTLTLGDSLTLQGTAITYSGTPVTGAKVKYEIDVIYAYLFGRHSQHDILPNDIVGTTTTETEGIFHIPLRLPDSSSSDSNVTYNYIVTAHVTDLNGETHSARTSFIVGQRTKIVSLSTPEHIMHRDSISYTLRTLNGTRLSEQVTLRLSKLRVPHSDHILTSVESECERWDEERVVIERHELTSADRDSHIAITPDMLCGTYRITITYTDGEKEHSEVRHFELLGEGKHTVSSHALYITNCKSNTVQTGDTAVLYIGTRHEEVHIHYYVRYEDRVVDKGTLTLDDETSSLRIPIREEWNNKIAVYLVSVKDNIKRITSETFNIAYKFDQLNVHLSTLRNTLEPGDTEQCAISISDYYGNPVQAALTLSIYDAALDSYGLNSWTIHPAPTKWWGWHFTVKIEERQERASDNNPSFNARGYAPPKPSYYTLPLVDDTSIELAYLSISSSEEKKTRANAKNFVKDAVENEESSDGSASTEARESEFHIRKDLSHTALFIPTLHTDEQGKATFTFTAPDLYSKWHIKGIAHTKDILHGQAEYDFVTHKTLMVQPNVPRFLYEGDTCHFTAKVTNLTNDSALVKLEIAFHAPQQQYSPMTITSSPLGSTAVSYPLVIPTGATSLTYRITAHTKQHSDGEIGEIPILLNRTLVTETMTLYTNATEKREFIFESLRSNNSPTLAHKSLKLDIVSTPLWYALEALAPLSKDENPSNERLFHCYYAVTMGQYLIDHTPEVEGHSDFFHRDSLSTQQHEVFRRLREAQNEDGGWSWMEGFESDTYTTLLIIKGLGELKTMNCLSITRNESLYPIVKRALNYLDREYLKDFNEMKEKPQELYSYQLYYLYVRSHFPEIPFGHIRQTAHKHYTKLLLKSKSTQGTLMQKALKMLTLIQLGKQKKAQEIAEVVKQSALYDDEMGVYWRDNTRGWRWSWGWDSNATATQALLIEAFVQLGQPVDMVAHMQQWLLKQKQATHWDSSITTAQAVHALVTATPHSFTEESKINVKVGTESISTTPHDKHGTIHHTWRPEDISPSLAKVELQKSTATPSWGAMTWQYYEEADKVSSSGTGLSLKIRYYKVEQVRNGERLTLINDSTPLTKGDYVRTIATITADRDMEYVALHQQRPASFEPQSTHSGIAFAARTLYYRSIENTRNVYYFYRLGKGEYTLSQDLWVSQSGSYASGISTIQCMYAPEFIATAESRLLNIGK